MHTFDLIDEFAATVYSSYGQMRREGNRERGRGHEEFCA
jgi:hypothetical protein